MISVAFVILKVTKLVPCVVPKFVPVIVIASPTYPEVGEMHVICAVFAGFEELSSPQPKIKC
jgi:hypothetical protein